MKAPAAPFALDLVSQKLVKPSAGSGGSRTELSCFDCITVLTATCRAWGFQGARIDVAALEAALEATLTDLPFLAGRLGRMKGMRLGSLFIEPTAAGALLTVAETDEVSMGSMGPDGWPQQGITIADPAVPFYIESMDTGMRLLAGKEPLMKVRLTKLLDGDILAVTLCHVITDGMRWPALAAHLAARYRQTAGGAPAPAAELLRPADRRLLSSKHMSELLLGERPWATTGLRVRGSLAGYWRLAKLLLADARQSMDLVLLHIPAATAAQLKLLAAGGNPAVTTGDAVQAVCALLLHAAHGKPLLPVAPQAMMALVQLPTPLGYFGNAVQMLRVKLPAGTAQPAAGDYAGALQQLAGAVRLATAAFRANPEESLKALHDTEMLVAAPAPRMLAFLAGKRLPLLTCTTNYVPEQQGIDLGLSQTATYIQGMTMPRARDMAVIRPAVAPYSDGLFVQLCLAPQRAAALRQLPMLAQLLPEASFVGGS